MDLNHKWQSLHFSFEIARCTRPNWAFCAAEGSSMGCVPQFSFVLFSGLKQQDAGRPNWAGDRRGRFILGMWSTVVFTRCTPAQLGRECRAGSSLGCEPLIDLLNLRSWPDLACRPRSTGPCMPVRVGSSLGCGPDGAGWTLHATLTPSRCGGPCMPPSIETRRFILGMWS